MKTNTNIIRCALLIAASFTFGACTTVVEKEKPATTTTTTETTSVRHPMGAATSETTTVRY